MQLNVIEASFDDAVIDIIKNRIPVFGKSAYYAVNLSKILQDVIIDLDGGNTVIRIKGCGDDVFDFQCPVVISRAGRNEDIDELYPCHCVSLYAKHLMYGLGNVHEVGVGLELDIE